MTTALSSVRIEAHEVPVGAAAAEVLDHVAAAAVLAPSPPAQTGGELLAVGGEGAHRDGGLGRQQALPPAVPSLRWSERNRAASCTSPTSPP
jgi:hypothetical protein